MRTDAVVRAKPINPGKGFQYIDDNNSRTLQVQQKLMDYQSKV
jgi:hypothetical protein